MFLFDLQPLFFHLAVAYARIAPIFYLLPFLTDNQLNSQIVKNTMILLVAYGFWSVQTSAQLPLDDSLEYLMLVSRETLIGFTLGIMLSLPFWIMSGVGAIIDNQRGATISSTMDPLTGVDTPELANFFNLFSLAVYLQGGGMLLVMQALDASYRIYPLTGPANLNLPAVMSVLDHLVGRALVIAAPVVLCLFFTEVVLGLLSRFSQQLNAFSVAMTVKSLVAFFILMLYFNPIVLSEMRASHDLGLILSLLQKTPFSP